METVFQHRMEAAGSRAQRARVWLGVTFDTVGEAVKEWGSTMRTTMGGDGMYSVRNDIRHAIRGLARTPGASLIAIVTLALGIGANTATFSVVDGVLLKPLAFEDPDRIVSVWPEANFNTAMVNEVAAGSPALEEVAGISIWTAVLAEAGDPTEIDVALVTPSYFRILGVAPVLGRALLDEEVLAAGRAVVVLSHDLWVGRFGADPEIVGRSIRLSVDDVTSHTVVGVMPPGYRAIPMADAWVPLPYDGAEVRDDSSWYVNLRVARLAPGATIEQASEQVRVVARRMAPIVPNQFDEEMVAAAGVTRLKDAMTEGSSTALWVLLGAVGLVLFIACANVANLLLARGEMRRKDIAVRTALGASRRTILRLLLIEALVIGGIGGAVGILTAYASTDLIIALAPAEIPRMDTVSVDAWALGFAFGVTLLATILSGLWPALRSSRVDPGDDLGGTTRSTSGRRSSRVVSHGLISLEMALAVVVTVGSALMLRSLNELLTVDTGFEPEGVVAFRPNPLGTGRSGVEEYRSLYVDLLARLEGEPGVESVGAVQVLTGSGNNWSFPTWPEGYAIPDDGGAPNVNFRAVLPGYFETLKIPLLRGRLIDHRDRDGSEAVAIVNRAFVEEFWPGESGLDRAFRIFSTDADPIRIVGVVGDIRQHGLGREPRPELYVPYMDWDWEMSAWMFVRTNDADAFKAQLRSLVDEVDPSAPISEVEDLEQVFARSAAETRFFTVLLTVFGLLGLALGAIGIYGVTSYSVARRTSEFGVRLALGASRRDVIGAAMRGGAGPVLVGATAGLATSLVGTRWLRTYLYEVQPTDPLAFAVVVIALGTVAASALAVPAWKAGRVDPVEALASE